MQDFKTTLSTHEGRVIRIFDELYTKYGNTLPAQLDRRAIPLEFGKILRDKNAYKRLQDFYNTERGITRHAV